MGLCRNIDRCGACSLLELEYGQALLKKRRVVEDAFLGEGIRIPVHPVEGMEEPYHYRNKVIAYLTMKGGHVVYGLYEENTHSIVYTPDCLLQNEVLNGVLESIRELMDKGHVRTADHGGTVKNVLLRIGVRSGQVMVVFVTASDMFHGSRELVKELAARHPQIRSVVQNVNPRDTSVVLGRREKVLYGSPVIYDSILGHRFKISPRSFFQINPVQTEKLYSKAIGLAALNKDEMLMDAYCGIGTIGICASDSAGWVTGVEINEDAVRDAIANARSGGVRNARFFCADVSAFMRDFEDSVDVLVLDPPRSGCDSRFLRSVLQMAPGRIVYVSCNPETQARDVRQLMRAYEPVGGAWPFDMFPHTAHVENIVKLERRKM